MSEVSEAVTLVFFSFLMVAAGYEIKRRQQKLRAVYDVLDVETKHIAAGLEQMVQQGELRPYTGETVA
ncbi:MAG: hypothetical protein DM484_25820 [Candidatus Methylumidiphilus alinenensis]|uniref:Uncharacterized protein n=1 Tax=Candidatus Methylumidiphilus alinenensis TaxID=2202197 RepID=A0A2W4QHW2_9GAMM|nr:MAG: hypothetical protein DM484_25820 [Candidatus Methylumidiphilus alinenensis]